VIAADTAARCQHLQALEDAIRYRRARVAGPCGACAAAPGRLCEDHGRDLGLIGEYERTAGRLLRAAPYALGSDTRVTAAAALLAEDHQPSALATADLRRLLARYSKRLAEVLDAIAEAGS